jgi:inhibitor of KinA
MKWIPYGPNAWLLRFAERLGDNAFARGRAIALELERHPPPGLIEFVPAFTTVLLEFADGCCGERERAALAARFIKACKARLPTPVLKKIPVVYDGPDLARVAEHNRISVDEVCRRHAATEYKVYALGFAPGFPYLGELDPRLHTPRLDSPRTRVPAGAVAIGGPHTGIYPVDGPGGWNLIGRTTTKLFQLAAASPRAEILEATFFLHPGDRVRFVRQRENSTEAEDISWK